jgi:hypothetical protein
MNNTQSSGVLPHQFALYYQVMDSCNEFIVDKEGKVILFNSVDEAIEFRKGNDNTKIKTNSWAEIEDCYICLYEEQVTE